MIEKTCIGFVKPGPNLEGLVSHSLLSSPFNHPKWWHLSISPTIHAWVIVYLWESYGKNIDLMQNTCLVQCVHYPIWCKSNAIKGWHSSQGHVSLIGRDSLSEKTKQNLRFSSVKISPLIIFFNHPLHNKNIYQINLLKVRISFGDNIKGDNLFPS